ncbi:MAG: decaprenyl-phosphate phosphoribosyltransferase [Paludibacteraceae bacterium]|jgi:4-hydroxybenzoate polyprenyltransferase|nr:decaprenyl-phosphate phosphoribosyltransferase [Paludibacteraceae bacterium]
MLKEALKIVRPQQWVKNLFVFLPIFFDKHLFEIEYLLPTIVVFVAFCAIASSIYCLNDIFDVESDRVHLQKRERPIASGKISKQTAYIIMIICATVSAISIIIGDFSLGDNKSILGIIILTYFFMNIAYCIGLKNKAIVDIFIIAIGFVLRVLAGGFASGIWLSQWIILMTFLLSLFLALAKRRDDVVLFQETGEKTRKNVDTYNIPFLNAAISIVGSVTLVSYIMYTLSPEVTERFGSQNLYLTSGFVLAAIIRYIQITFVDENSGSPTKILLHDHFIQTCIIGWLLSFGIIIYL